MKKLILLSLLLLPSLAVAQSSHSGIMGRSLLYGSVGEQFVPSDPTKISPYPTRISVYTVRGRLVEEIATNSQGEFSLNLNPGDYVLVPLAAPFSPAAPPIVVEPVKVTVPQLGYTPVTVWYVLNVP
jgi:hypothetical protein